MVFARGYMCVLCIYLLFVHASLVVRSRFFSPGNFRPVPLGPVLFEMSGDGGGDPGLVGPVLFEMSGDGGGGWKEDVAKRMPQDRFLYILHYTDS